MHRLNELVAKLTPDQVKEVEDFAEFLLSRNGGPATEAKPEYLDIDSFAGTFADLAPGKTDVELQHEALEARASEDRD